MQLASFALALAPFLAHAPRAGIAQAPLLPAPSGPLQFDPGTREIALYALLLQLAQLTGQELALTATTRLQLEQDKETLESTAPVPKEEVYAFVEGLLARRRVVIAPLSGGSRPVLGVLAGSANQDGALDPLYVEADALGQLAGHPALHVRTILLLKNLDARQVQTQLRQLTVDNQGLSQCVPVGELGLILQGRGREVEALARVVLAADKAGAMRPSPKPVEPKEGG